MQKKTINNETRAQENKYVLCVMRFERRIQSKYSIKLFSLLNFQFRL